MTRWIDAAFLLLLWRLPDEREQQEARRALDAGQSAVGLVARLIASTEFRLLQEGLDEGASAISVLRPVATLEANLGRLGPDDVFVSLAYEIVLGRAVDPTGQAFYLGELGRGQSRILFLRSLFQSDEFGDRYASFCPNSGFVPRDTQLCELANPAKWDNPDWRALLRSLHVVPTDKMSMHRKAYEFGQLLYGLTRLGAVRSQARVLSVGAGHEPVLYWLANRVDQVVAADLYEGVWQGEGSMEGDARVMTHAAEFAPFPYAVEKLVFLKMDGRALAFAPGSFDVVYSLSSIEHFGGLEAARMAMAEMACVLRPGGVLAVATEYVLAGPSHPEAFQPADVQRLFEHPQLRLVEPIDDAVWRRYAYVPIDLRVNPHQTPHMVVRDNQSVFTSVMAFFERIGGGSKTAA